ncbi:MAG: myo-inosose-2 dehydratase [Alphaproteobacteria bacterium]|nr:myo-inosose-2 dehydratase [Alphaproteobacteria bacterium]
MAVRIGINPITWSNDDMPELGGATPLETCLAETHAAGYAGIELGNKFPRDAATLRPILERHGLALVSGWYSGGLLGRSVVEEIEAVEDHLALLAALGCTVMVFAETTGSIAGARGTGPSQRPRLKPEDWAGFGGKLTALADHLARRGVAMAYHHHMGTVVQSEEDVDRLMAATGPSVGLLLDTGHLAYAGADPLAVVKRWKKRINHVHCKDIRRAILDRVRAEDASFLDSVVDGVFTVPGDGAIDYPPILAVLREAGYSGWVVVEAEQDPAKAHPLTYARMGFEYLSAAVARAGL